MFILAKPEGKANKAQSLALKSFELQKVVLQDFKAKSYAFFAFYVYQGFLDVPIYQFDRFLHIECKIKCIVVTLTSSIMSDFSPLLTSLYYIFAKIPETFLKDNV